MRLGFFVFVSLLMFACRVGAQPDALYQEQWRPGYHHSPPTNWANEENGLIYHDGLYHMFYQHNPFNNQWGNMSWGHAVSPDLVHWTNLPVAIPGENGVMAFSGTAVHDVSNTSGLGASGEGPLIAAYTGWTFLTGRQDQRLAYSNDGGMTWTKYAGNPVLDIGSNEFRDPKVLWHEPTQKWVMINAHGGQRRVTFWTSDDLLTWTFASEFNGAGMPSGFTGWEVPDLFELPVELFPGATRWVLVLTPAQSSPAGGNGVAYFVGDFDGTTFTSENPAGLILWADYGRDFDGVLSWEGDPLGRRIWTGIMNSYGGSVPTTPWRGCFALPREVTLRLTDEGIRLLQSPIAEVEQLRGAPAALLANETVSPGTDPLGAFNVQGDMLEIIASFSVGTATRFGLDVREGPGQRTRIGYDATASEMFMDRTFSGRTDFHPDAGGVHVAPMNPANGVVTLRIFVDRSTVEVFGNDGRRVISNLIFPSPSSTGVSLFAEGGDVLLSTLIVYPLDDIWPEVPAKPASDVLVRWSMDAVPQNAGGNNPVVIDQRTAQGEGTDLGTTDALYEPGRTNDHLWMINGLPNGGPYLASGDVPPPSMFADGFDGGDASYDAGAIFGVNGALFMPNDKYGAEFDFTGSFTLECFFRTDGDRSQDGWMQLLLQGDTGFRFGIIVNEGGPGNVRFAIHDQQSSFPIVDINSVSGRNYADGQWHYLKAVYDATDGPTGSLSLTIANEDGTSDTAVAAIPGSFQGLPPADTGNLHIGRSAWSFGGDHRTFRGLIDEVQITDGVVPRDQQLGLPLPQCLGDANGDAAINFEDLNLVLANWATSGPAGDVDGSGDVDFQDLNLVLSAWGTGC